MDTLGHDAPSLSRGLIPLLLYADDLTIMSTTPAGLQRLLNALQLFCEQPQLSVNLAKTKVVTFGSRAKCQAFTSNGNKVERVQSYKYLGFEFHATKKSVPWCFQACFCCVTDTVTTFRLYAVPASHYTYFYHMTLGGFHSALIRSASPISVISTLQART